MVWVRTGCKRTHPAGFLLPSEINSLNYLKHMEFSPLVDDDVIRSTLQPEVDELMLEENWNAGKGNGKEHEGAQK